MKRKRLILLVGLLVVLLTISMVFLSAFADQGRQPKNLWCYKPLAEPDPEDFIFQYPMGANLFTTASYDSMWTGTISGVSKDNALVLWREPQDGPATFVDLIVFDSAVVGRKSGSLELHLYGAGDFSNWEGDWYITEAAGELVGLEGYGKWWGPYQGDGCDEGYLGAYYQVKQLKNKP
jgi:hypothetical protein